MSGTVPSFFNASKAAIKIGDEFFAYIENLSFSDDMSVQPMRGIGTYNPQTLEPTNYIGRWSATISNYSELVRSAILASSGGDTSVLPQNLVGVNVPTDINASGASTNVGNTLLRSNLFNPVRLLVSLSFTISTFERELQTDGSTTIGPEIYVLNNCRAQSYAISFTPGQVVRETVTGLCTSIVDRRAGG
jgi:hypothetical protein